MLTNFLLAAALALQTAAAPPPATAPAPVLPQIAVGQVWEYQARPQDVGSLLKVQQTEKIAGTDVFHITVVRVQLGGQSTALQHLPMAREALQASVTQQVPDPGFFPSPDEGIASWRAAKGGVFTLPVAQVIDMVEGSIGGAPRN